MSRTTRVSRYQKGKTNLDLLKQETVSGSGISWAICKPAPRSRQITTPAPHHSVFLHAGCPSYRPTNNVSSKYLFIYFAQNKRNVKFQCTKQAGTARLKSTNSRPSKNTKNLATHIAISLFNRIC